VRLSPTLAVAFLGCNASAAWTLEARRGLRVAAESADDPQAALVIRKGHEHEAACLSGLKERCGDFVEIPSGTLKTRFAATVDAMERGVPLIYQAALTAGAWLGYADFLIRVEESCPRWAWSYEPWDAKLARSPRPEHLFQIALYGDLLAAVQGALLIEARSCSEPATPNRPTRSKAFASTRFATMSVVRPGGLMRSRPSCRRALRRIPAPIAQSAIGWPYVRRGGKRRITSARVADITKRQTRRLIEAGVSTLSMLATLDGARIAGIAPETLDRLAQQARLQEQTATSGLGALEIIPHRPGLGFDKLPQADAGDLFFDFEGDPMYPGGLEYLCGVLWLAVLGDEEGEPIPGHPNLRFLAFWAHDRVQEREAFAELMAFLMARLARFPRRASLSLRTPTKRPRSAAWPPCTRLQRQQWNEILRTNRMVDLYRVVREGVRVGEPGYSIKNLERFYMAARTTAVASGGDSLVIYDRFRETGECSLLNDLRDYNRNDCLSNVSPAGLAHRARQGIGSLAASRGDFD